MEKRKTERVGWHHLVYAHEFEQALVGGEGQGGPICCSSWGHKELDMTEQQNNKKKEVENCNLLIVEGYL